MKALNCPNCGASLSRHNIKADLAVCEFCGSTFHMSQDLRPESGQGALLLSADFGSRILPGWEVIDEGKLTFHRGNPSELRGNYGTRISAYYVLKSSGFFDDFDAGINIRFTDGDQNLIMAGLYPRFTNEGGYAVYISPMGSYVIGYFTKDQHGDWKWETLMDWTNHSALRAGMNENNYLRVVCDGERIRVYLNGVLAASFKDGRFKMGKLCVVAEPNGETNLGIAFSDLQLREIPR
ncbi:MAG TPA: hypothetical protein VFR47_33810 [Anaerolineales bacterium]|nr:hypothetical protein [Anaerolineales bacterium]